jgi:secernin
MCDIVCSLVDGPHGRRLLFGKNSDREPGEAQAVEVHPSRWGLGGEVACTHRAVPQVERTRAVLLSRPCWMWGAEMGANDAGVVAGNEAVFTRLPVARTGLTGMDLLRLALERAASAREAAQVVIELLARYPQGGRMGHRDLGFRYHSSFLFGDAGEAWVLETAGRFWALEPVVGSRALSNELSIGEPAQAHPGAADEARSRGWLARGEAFHFARAFGSPLYRRLTGARQRLACTGPAAASMPGLSEAMAALRRHRGAHPAAGLRLESPCAHASWLPTRAAGQTTASMVSEVAKGTARHFFTGTSAPCLSVFKPVTFESELPVTATEVAGEGLFWRHERLHRAVLDGWEARAPLAVELAAALQEAALAPAASPRVLWEAHAQALPAWTAQVLRTRGGGPPVFRAFWRRQARRDAG